MIQIIDDKRLQDQWNTNAVNPMQSWEWGEVRKQMGVDVVRIAETDGDKFINVFQITFHKIPHTRYTIGYLPRSVIPSQKVIEQLSKEAKMRNCIFVKIEPYVTKLETLNAKHLKNEKLNSAIFNNFQLFTTKSSHPLFPDWTQIVDLTKSETELFKNLKSKTRYNIRLAQKHGVVIKEMTNDVGFEIFSKLYFDTCRRQNYRGHDQSYHKIIFNNLKNNISRILIAYYNNQPLAAYQLFLFNEVLYYPYGGSSLHHKNIMAPNLLMWEAIKLGISSHAKYFDMWGSLPPATEDNNYINEKSDWSGFTRFKEGYGGQYSQFIGSYDLIINKSLYTFYNIVYRFRKLFI